MAMHKECGNYCKQTIALPLKKTMYHLLVLRYVPLYNPSHLQTSPSTAWLSLDLPDVEKPLGQSNGVLNPLFSFPLPTTLKSSEQNINVSSSTTAISTTGQENRKSTSLICTSQDPSTYGIPMPCYHKDFLGSSLQIPTPFYSLTKQSEEDAKFLDWVKIFNTLEPHEIPMTQPDRDLWDLLNKSK